MGLEKVISKDLAAVKDLYRKIAFSYGEDEVTKELFELEEKHILPVLKKFNFKDKRVLDAGCGTGRWTAFFIKKGAKVTGIDISSEMLAEAVKLNKADFKLMDARDLNFKDNSFDVVFSSLMLSHIEDFENALFEIKRVVKPGGLVILSDLHGSLLQGEPTEMPFKTPEGIVWLTSYPIFPSKILKCLGNCSIIKILEIQSDEFFINNCEKPNKNPLLLITILKL